MDRSWINLMRWTSEYRSGLNNFLDYAFVNASTNGKIYCPCKRCCNNNMGDRDLVEEHLIINGMSPGYTHLRWAYHGEKEISDSMSGDTSPIEEDGDENFDDIQGMLHEAFGFPSPEEGTEEDNDAPNLDAAKFYNLVKDADQDLYPGCKKYTVLSFIIRLYQLKCLHGFSDKGFTALLNFLKDVFPYINETMPKSFYYTKKLIQDLGLGYSKIDACPNDCMLYRKDSLNDTVCSICNTSRWKTTDDGVDFGSTKDKKIPAKVLHHFPLKPRLQRLFMSNKTAGLMRWHADEHTNDGVLRHPADSEAWKTLDKSFPGFSAETRNVRLGLATDGFNPFGLMSLSHSTWPVVLMPYNLPPWLCMKQPNFIMSLLIPGPMAPGNDIDVYLQPLIDELKELWVDGICTYDASLKQNFMMHAALLWTINDFPAYANLSGWSTKGYLACPHCNVDVDKKYLYGSHKCCYIGHRRFLDPDHSFRSETSTFNGMTEMRPPPLSLTGAQMLDQMHDINNTFGKLTKGGDNREDGWQKKSIFFTLPYWEHLLIRHNLDVMHIEKNICESLVGTLLDIPYHTKDSFKAREDLKELRIRADMLPYINPKTNKQCYKPAIYTMDKKAKDIFCNVLGKVKLPDGYAANISRCVNLKKRTITGMKSHDYHIIMQQLLPLAVRKALPYDVARVLIELSSIFRDLCSKIGTIESFMDLERRIALTLCELEKIFLPAFFDVMVHLAIHLPSEARIAGPVQYRWMYPIERSLHTLKAYVRNKSRLEGSIAQGYLVEECLTFCTRYLHDVETKSTRIPRNYEPSSTGPREGLSIFSRPGRSMGKVDIVLLSHKDREAMHSYLLFNCPEVAPFLEEHYKLIEAQSPNEGEMVIKRRHKAEFPNWFKEKVHRAYIEGGDAIRCDIYWLARGPMHTVKKYKRFVVNGFRFRILDVDKNKRTQNSGVVLTAKTANNDDCMYYGLLTDIIEVDYHESRKVVLFKCIWVHDNGSAIKKDKFGITIVNSKRFVATDEPYIIAAQALQVFYVDDPVAKDWKVAIKILPRDYFNLTGEEGSIDDANMLSGI